MAIKIGDAVQYVRQATIDISGYLLFTGDLGVVVGFNWPPYPVVVMFEGAPNVAPMLENELALVTVAEGH